jgi:protein SMG6
MHTNLIEEKKEMRKILMIHLFVTCLFMCILLSLFSASSNGSVERFNNNSDNFSSNFKMPFPKSTSANNNNRQRRNSQSSYNSRENSMERSYGGGFNNSRESSLDRRHHRARRFQNRRGSDNYHSSRENSTERFNSNWSAVNNAQDEALSWRRGDELTAMGTRTDQKIAELTKQFENSVELACKTSGGGGGGGDFDHQRVLFDPNNPNNPIVVKQSQSRSRDYTMTDAGDRFNDNQQYSSVAKPVWFKKTSEQYQKMIKSKRLIDELNELDNELVGFIEKDILANWQPIVDLREKIQKIFEELLRVDMKFCQAEHVEHYFWKLLYYRMIEILRKQMQDNDDINARAVVKDKALEIVDTGTKYFESLLLHLEFCHKFKIEDFIGENAAIYNTKRGLGYVGLALVSSQKIFLFLGDLARYREQINLTNNFGRAKNYYVKAQQIVPKNGRPFNQLALLAVYSVSI